MQRRRSRVCDAPTACACAMCHPGPRSPWVCCTRVAHGLPTSTCCSCCLLWALRCSVQYLQQPERVFAELYRTLKPGGVAIFSFSNRLYYSKAIAAWRDASGYARTQLVRSYFQSVEGFTSPEALTEVSAPSGQSGAPPPSLLPDTLAACLPPHAGGAYAAAFDRSGKTFVEEEREKRTRESSLGFKTKEKKFSLFRKRKKTPL